MDCDLSEAHRCGPGWLGILNLGNTTSLLGGVMVLGVDGYKCTLFSCSRGDSKTQTVTSGIRAHREAPHHKLPVVSRAFQRCSPITSSVFLCNLQLTIIAHVTGITSFFAEEALFHL